MMKCYSSFTVFGFFNTTFSAEESSIAISVPMGYLSGVPPSSFAGLNLQVQGITASKFCSVKLSKEIFSAVHYIHFAQNQVI